MITYISKGFDSQFANLIKPIIVPISPIIAIAQTIIIIHIGTNIL
jgi:hypothetical protein